MHTRLLAGCCVLCLTGALLTSTLQAAPPPLPPPGTSEDEVRRMLTERIRYWVARIRNSATAKDVVTARRGLTVDYDAARVNNWAASFAHLSQESLQPILTDALKKDDPLRKLKQINVAMAVSAMPQPAARPTLEIMVTHTSPAVRYLGWIGFLQIRPLLASQEDAEVNEFVALVKAAAARETSPVVIGALIDLFNIRPTAAAAMPAPAVAKLRQGARETLVAMWPAGCKQALLGSLDWPQTMVNALPVLIQLNATLGDDNQARTQIFQMIIDAMWCAGVGYEKATHGMADESLSPAERQRYHKRWAAATALLRISEKALRVVTETKKSPVQKALGGNDPQTLVEDVRLAIHDWIGLLATRGVVAPKHEKFGVKKEPTTQPGPETRPTTAPARTQPTTKPKPSTQPSVIIP